MAITISGENNNDKILASDGVIDQLSGVNLVGVLTATTFSGDFIGDLTGNVTGNINNSTLLLQTGGTERLRIDSAGHVLIGTSAPGYSTADDLTIATSGSTGITIRTGTTNQGNIYFADGTSGATQYAGLISYNHANNFMFFGTNDGTERLRIDSSGRLLIGTTTEGNESADELTINSSGNTGITLRSGTSDNTSLFFSDATSGAAEYAGFVQYQHASNAMIFGTSSTERIRIESGGDVDIKSGVLKLASGANRRLMYRSGNNDVLLESDSGDFYRQNINNSSHSFFTGNNERLRIASDGKVGINQSSPRTTLDVSGYVYLGNGGQIQITGSAGAKGLQLAGADDGANIIGTMGSSGEHLVFRTASSERMRLLVGGPHLLLGGTSSVYEITETSGHAGMVIGSTSLGNAGLAIINSTSGTGRIYFGDATANNAGRNRGMINYYHSSDYMMFATAGSERLRIASDGVITAQKSATFGNTSDSFTAVNITSSTSGISELRFADTTANAGYVKYEHSGNNLIFATNATERARITSTGEVGISPGTVTPSAGDMSSGDSQNTPIIHVKGSGTSATQGAYNLLARFEAGGDADGTGAMIVLNHSNDRGLAIQGGRRTGNYAHGALKMIDNVGRVSDAMLIHGGAGQGVDHINFYTGVSTTTTNRLHIDSAGRVLIGTTNNSNGHIAASKAAVHGHLAIFKDSEGDLAGVNSHQLKFVTQSGSISEIQATSNGAGGPAGRGGYLSFFAKENNNSTLKEMVRVRTDYLHVLRENTSLEGGQIALSRASDNAAYWMIDSYGSSSTPDFRLHAGGTSHFSINASGQWVDAPPGTIIQVGYARYDPNNDGYSSISQDTRASSAVYLDFTPRRSDSKLMIMTRMHTRMINAYGCSYGIEQSTNSGSSYSDVDGMNQRNAMDFFYKGDAVNHHFTGFCMRQIDSYSGSRRFRPWGQGWSGGTWEVSYGHGEHSVTIYEVAV